MYFLWPVRSFYRFKCEEGELAYIFKKDHAVVIGPPKAHSIKKQTEVLQTFFEYCEQAGYFTCGYYFPRNLIPNRSLQIRLGVECFLDLNVFNLKGSRWKEVRRARNHFRRKKWFLENSKSLSNLRELKALSRKWRKRKSVLELSLFLQDMKHKQDWGEFEQASLLRDQNGKIIAGATWLSYFTESGQKAVYMDQLIYDPQAPRQALSALLTQLFLQLKDKGIDQVNLGLSPFYIPHPQGFLEKVMAICYHLPWPYNSQGLFHFKKRFSNRFEERFLLLNEHSPGWKQLLLMGRATIRTPSLFLPWETKARPL